MNMDAKILSYLIPTLAFALIFGFTFLGFTLWKNWIDPKTRAVRQHIENIRQVRPEGSSNPLTDEQGKSTSPWLSALKKKLPFTRWLKLIILRAGINKTFEDILLLILAMIAIGLLVLLLTPLPTWLAVPGGLASGLIPVLYLMRKGYRRRLRFEQQLPEALGFLARSLKAGHGLTIAMSMLANEVASPLGSEFKIVVDQLNFGLPFDETLQNLSVRVNSQDLDFFISSLIIQRETGSNLAELLITLGNTIRDRMKLAGKVRALSAEGKLSGIFLAFMPFAMALLIQLINPDYMEVMWTTETGHTLIKVGLVMLLLGSIWISKIIKIKV